MAAITREQLHDMLDLVLDINGMEERCQSITDDKPTAFMKFSGHVFDISIDIYKNGYDYGKEPDINKCIELLDGKIYQYQGKTRQYLQETWDDIMEELNAIKNDCVKEKDR